MDGRAHRDGPDDRDVRVRAARAQAAGADHDAGYGHAHLPAVVFMMLRGGRNCRRGCPRKEASKDYREVGHGVLAFKGRNEDAKKSRTIPAEC
jgi:hypothetical protein